MLVVRNGEFSRQPKEWTASLSAKTNAGEEIEEIPRMPKIKEKKSKECKLREVPIVSRRAERGGKNGSAVPDGENVWEEGKG